jgi:hypothetical protein
MSDAGPTLVLDRILKLVVVTLVGHELRRGRGHDPSCRLSMVVRTTMDNRYCGSCSSGECASRACDGNLELISRQLSCGHRATGLRQDDSRSSGTQQGGLVGNRRAPFVGTAAQVTTRSGCPANPGKIDTCEVDVSVLMGVVWQHSCLPRPHDRDAGGGLAASFEMRSYSPEPPPA